MNAELADCPELMALFTRTMTTDIEDLAEEEGEPVPAQPTTPGGLNVTGGPPPLSPITPGLGPEEADVTGDIAPPDISGFDNNYYDEQPSVVDQAAAAGAGEEEPMDRAEREREEREEELVPVESWSERYVVATSAALRLCSACDSPR